MTARGSLMRYSWELNPFVYAVSRRSRLSALELRRRLRARRPRARPDPADRQDAPRSDFRLPPGASRSAAQQTGTDLATRLLRFDLRVGERLFLTLNAPIEVNWRKPAVEWSVGLGLTYAPGSSQAAGGPLIRSHSEKTERTRRFLVASGRSLRPSCRPEAFPVRRSGRDDRRDPGWGGPRPAVRSRLGRRQVDVGSRSLGRAVRLGAGRGARDRRAADLGRIRVPDGGLQRRPALVRPRPSRPVAPAVRIEGGPKVHGRSENDLSQDVHGSADSQYYFQAGSRLGIAFNAGIIDLLVEGPTIAWRSQPFKTGEILTFGLGIRLN